MKLAAWIERKISEGYKIQVTTCTNSWIFRHNAFSTDSDGNVMMQIGKRKSAITMDNGNIVLCKVNAIR